MLIIKACKDKIDERDNRDIQMRSQPLRHKKSCSRARILKIGKQGRVAFGVRLAVSQTAKGLNSWGRQGCNNAKGCPVEECAMKLKTRPTNQPTLTSPSHPIEQSGI